MVQLVSHQKRQTKQKTQYRPRTPTMVINALLSEASSASVTRRDPSRCIFCTGDCQGFKTILCKAQTALPRISINTESSDYAMLQICMIHISAAFLPQK